MNEIKKTSVFRHGHVQVVEIPTEFELLASEVTIRRAGDALVIAPKPKKMSLIEALDQMETIDIEFPDVDAGLLPLRDVKL